MRGSAVVTKTVKTLRCRPCVKTCDVASGPRGKQIAAPAAPAIRQRQGMRYSNLRSRKGSAIAVPSTTAMRNRFAVVMYKTIESASVPRAARSIGQVNGLASRQATGTFTAV